MPNPAAAAATRVLGIDPGSQITGIGLIEERGGALHHIHSESLVLPRQQLALRLKHIYDGVQAAIENHRPQLVAIEKVFMANNARAALTLGQARGAAVCAAVCAGLPVAEYSARHIKKAVVGYGAADKRQVQHMVRALLGMTTVPAEDAADALACAICLVHSLAAERAVQRSEQLQRPRPERTAASGTGTGAGPGTGTPAPSRR